MRAVGRRCHTSPLVSHGFAELFQRSVLGSGGAHFLRYTQPKVNARCLVQQHKEVSMSRARTVFAAIALTAVLACESVLEPDEVTPGT